MDLVSGLLARKRTSNRPPTEELLPASLVTPPVTTATTLPFTLPYVSQSNPVGNANPQTPGTIWMNVSSSEIFICTDNTSNRNEWLGHAGTRLLFARPESSSLTGSVQSTVSGSSFRVQLRTVDRFGQKITRDAGQAITIATLNATTAGSSGTYVGSGSGDYFVNVTTTNFSGSIVISSSIDASLVSNTLTIPVAFPNVVYGFGSNFGLHAATPRSGSGGPQRVNPQNIWASASCGDNYCLYLTADGRLFGQGTTTNAQLGSLIFPTPPGFGNLIDLGTATLGTQIGPWRHISAGPYHACGINIRNELYCWGNNSSGQTSNPSTGTITNPIQVIAGGGVATQWNTVSCGFDHTLAIRNDGTLWSWGANGSGAHLGRVGDGTAWRPFQVGSDTNWRSVFALRNTSHAIKTNGTLWGWGSNNNYELGDGTTTARNTPVQIGTDTDWVKVHGETAFRNETRVGIRGTRLFGWGRNFYTPLTSASQGQFVTTPTLIAPNIAVKDVAVARYATYLLDTGSGLWGYTNVQPNQVFPDVGATLAYGMSSSYEDTFGGATAANFPQSVTVGGATNRISSIYTHESLASFYQDGLVTIARIITGSAGPSGNPSTISSQSLDQTNRRLNVLRWVSGDSTAETQIQIISASNNPATSTTFWVRPGQNFISLQIPPASTGSAVQVRLSHIKNTIQSSGGVTSSNMNFCPGAFSEIFGTCDANGRRFDQTHNGICGFQPFANYCSTTCGGYTYTTTFSSVVCDCYGGNCTSLPFNRYTHSSGQCIVDEPAFTECNVWPHCC